MTELTEKYLRNYLQRKSLVIAAEQEVKETNLLTQQYKSLSALITPENKQIALRRQHNAFAMLEQLQVEELEAYWLYHDHILSEK